MKTTNPDNARLATRETPARDGACRAPDRTMTSAVSVSAVVPLFNKGVCVERAIRSIQAQTVPCREILVVDDGSTDGGHEIVEGIGDPRIRLFRQSNQGCSAARNKGIAEAQGGLIAFLDADDEWKPEFLETIVNLRARYPQAGAYATAYTIREPDGRIHIPRYRDIPPTPWEGILPNYFRSSLRVNPMWTSAVAIHREVFDTIGRFTLCPGVGEDAELWGRIALRYPIAFSRRIGAVYHKDAQNRFCETVFTHVFASDGFERAMHSPETLPHLLPDAMEFLARERLTAASRYILSGQSRTARSLLRDCRTRRFLPQKLWWRFWSLLPHRAVRLAWRGKRWFQNSLIKR